SFNLACLLSQMPRRTASPATTSPPTDFLSCKLQPYMRALPRAWAARFPRAGSPQTDFLSDKFQPCMLAHFPLTDRFNRYSPSCHLVPVGGAPAVDHSIALKARRGGEECGGRRRTAVCLLWRTGD